MGPGGRNPTYTTYRCKDGEWLFLAGLTPKFQANAAAAGAILLAMTLLMNGVAIWVRYRFRKKINW